MLVIWQEKGAPDLRKFIAKCAFICMLLLSFVYVGFCATSSSLSPGATVVTLFFGVMMIYTKFLGKELKPFHKS